MIQLQKNSIIFFQIWHFVGGIIATKTEKMQIHFDENN